MVLFRVSSGYRVKSDEPFPDFLFDCIPYDPDALEFFFVGSGNRARVGESPVEPFMRSGKQGAALRIALVADCNDEIEVFSAVYVVFCLFRMMAYHAYSFFFHSWNDMRIQVSCFDPGTVHFEGFPGKMTQKGFAYLAASRIMNAYENYPFFWSF